MTVPAPTAAPAVGPSIAEPGRTRLAVLGSPIAHSRSPLLHLAAYRALGLDWSYERIEVREHELAAFLDGLDDTWRGFSLTMPLKREALRQAESSSPVAAITNAVNTLSLIGGSRRGWNTDVRGVVQALRSNGIGANTSGTPALRRARVLGAGATATSVVAALARMGAAEVELVARRPEQAAELAALAARLGVVAVPLGWEHATEVPEATDVLVNTVPGAATAQLEFSQRARARVPLLEIVYDPWPSPLATAWQGAGGLVVSGLEMLLQQAVAQVRIFVSGDADARLPDEPGIVEAMRAALG